MKFWHHNLWSNLANPISKPAPPLTPLHAQQQHNNTPVNNKEEEEETTTQQIHTKITLRAQPKLTNLHQMSRQYVNPAGLRRDGRRTHEIRRLRCRFGPIGSSDGSVYLEHGCNKILAVVHGPRALASRSQGQFDRANISVTYTTAPFAKTEHRKIKNRDRRSEKIAATIQSTFESIVQTHLYPRSEIAVEIQVLQSDGGAVSSYVLFFVLGLYHQIFMTLFLSILHIITFSWYFFLFFLFFFDHNTQCN